MHGGPVMENLELSWILGGYIVAPVECSNLIATPYRQSSSCESCGSLRSLASQSLGHPGRRVTLFRFLHATVFDHFDPTAQGDRIMVPPSPPPPPPAQSTITQHWREKPASSFTPQEPVALLRQPVRHRGRKMIFVNRIYEAAWLWMLYAIACSGKKKKKTTAPCTHTPLQLSCWM